MPSRSGNEPNSVKEDAVKGRPRCLVNPDPVITGDAYVISVTGMPRSTTVRLTIDDAFGSRTVEVQSDYDGRCSTTETAADAGIGQVLVSALRKRGFRDMATCTYTVTSALICGDGSCDANEDCSSCANDCGTCGPACGNGTCDSGEDCSNCESDCGACGLVCGDDTCAAGEDCGNCESDCGVCGPVCGDGTCEAGEDCSNCESDCGDCVSCGDGTCQVSEDCGSCSADCGDCTAASITVSTPSELQTAIGNAQGGDIIEVEAGNYGALTINKNLTSAATVRAVSGATVVFTQLNIDGDHWIVSAVEVRPSQPIAAARLGGDYTVLRDSYITFADDTTGWSATDWINRTGNGIGVNGFNVVVENNYLKNVGQGIHGTGPGAIIRGNTIDSFRLDGIRPLGDDMLVEGNVIKNCINVDGNHDDGIQSWSRGPNGPGTGVVRGQTIRGNVIINYEDPNQPHRGTLQGIGYFDGMFEDLVIEDNVVFTDHWHGISVYGCTNVSIRYNTVVDRNNTAPGPSWIFLGNHKDGTPPSNSRIEYNLATDINAGAGVTLTGNRIISYGDYDAYFVDWQNFDFHLRSDAPTQGVGARQ